MTIQLKPEQERIIQEEIQSGNFRSPDEVLDHALAALREKSNGAQATVTPPRPRKRPVGAFGPQESSFTKRCGASHTMIVATESMPPPKWEVTVPPIRPSTS